MLSNIYQLLSNPFWLQIIPNQNPIIIEYLSNMWIVNNLIDIMFLWFMSKNVIFIRILNRHIKYWQLYYVFVNSIIYNTCRQHYIYKYTRLTNLSIRYVYCIYNIVAEI